jgi:hypothetical protein
MPQQHKQHINHHTPTYDGPVWHCKIVFDVPLLFRTVHEHFLSCTNKGGGGGDNASVCVCM